MYYIEQVSESSLLRYKLTVNPKIIWYIHQDCISITLNSNSYDFKVTLVDTDSNIRQRITLSELFDKLSKGYMIVNATYSLSDFKNNDVIIEITYLDEYPNRLNTYMWRNYSTKICKKGFYVYNDMYNTSSGLFYNARCIIDDFLYSTYHIVGLGKNGKILFLYRFDTGDLYVYNKFTCIESKKIDVTQPDTVILINHFLHKFNLRGS